MGAVRQPERLAVDHSPGERDRRVGEIIQRQDERRGQVSAARDQHQQPCEQKPDWQASNVTEKNPRHRPVERRKAEEPATERERNDDALRRQCAKPSDQRQTDCHRDKFGDCHPVDAVHEIGEIDEPEAGDEQHRALDPPRKEWRDTQVQGQAHDHGGDRERLQNEPRADADAPHIVGRSNQRDERGGRQHGPKRRLAKSGIAPAEQGDGCGDQQGCGDDGDPAALGRRCAVG